VSDATSTNGHAARNPLASTEENGNSSDGCYTCMAIPGQIVTTSFDDPASALVDVAGVRRNVDLTLIQDEPLAPGDWILVHVGFAISRVSEDEALAQLRVLEMLGPAGAVSENCDLGSAGEGGAPGQSNPEQSKAKHEVRR
jgi:hydrogenase expression/formation protein HypC